jgi:4-hydroxy-3-polyprenylbenzoate decarboxylase
MNCFTSLRDYLDALREIGDLVEIEREVDWNLEMGAIARRCYETGAPAPLFSSVKDAPGFRALSAPVSSSNQPGLKLARIALSLGLPARASAREIIDALVAARHRDPIAPVRVETGPCKENILLGSEADLTRLPLPYLHDGDGGRYLNTLGAIIVKSPDGSRTNWSVARIMMLDEHRATGAILPFQHIGEIHNQWREIGQDMPFALALGVEPMVLFAAGMPLPREIDEGDYVGAFTGQPVQVVKCETNDLEVPASAEIVIEGTVSVTELGLEGPMGDYGGYMYPEPPAPMPVYNIDAITHRDQAIFTFCCAGEPPEEDHTLTGVGMTAVAVNAMREAGLPVSTAWSPFESACGWMVITVTEDWREHEPDGLKLSRQLAETAIGTRGPGYPVKTFVVLEEDVDPANLQEVVWAWDGRNERSPEGQAYIDGVINWPMTPYIFPATGDYPQGWAKTRVVHNCLPPKGVTRPGRTGFKHNYKPALQQHVLANWESDGFPADPETTAAATGTKETVS